MENNNSSSGSFLTEIKEVLAKCKTNKLKIALAVIVALFLAFCYLYLRPVNYTAEASVTLNQESSAKGNLLRQFSIGSMLGGSSSVYNEMAFLDSHTTMMKVVKNLGLNTTYYERIGFLKSALVYPVPKVALEPNAPIADTLSTALTFKIKAMKEGKAEISCKAAGKKIGSWEGSLPMDVKTLFGEFKIYYTADSFKHKNVTETVIFEGYSTAAEKYLEAVNYSIPMKMADVVKMAYTCKNKQLGVDVLQEIIEEYNQRGIEFERAKAEKQLHFIDDRIFSLTHELKISEQEVKDFKERNKVSDISTDVEYLMEQKGKLEANFLALKSENEIIGSAIEFLKNPSNEYQIMPSLISSYDAPIEAYNNLILTRMRLAKSARPGNESLDQLDKQIALTRENILAVFERQKENSDLRLRELNSSLSSINSKIGQIPRQESIYRDIYRDQTIKEQLYVYLLEQREEAALTMLNTQGRGKVVNQPYINTLIKTKPGIIYIFIAFLAGLFFFPLVWYVKIVLVSK